MAISLAVFTISAYIRGIRSLSLLTTDVLAAAGGDCGRSGNVPAFFLGGGLMTAVVAMVLAHLTDPVRIAMMALALWIVWKATDPGWGRVVPTVVAIGGVAVLIALMLRGMLDSTAPFEDVIPSILVGCIANTVLVLILIGISRAVTAARQ